VPLSRTDIQQLRSLQQKKVRTATGLFVAEGVKVVTELVSSPLKVIGVYATKPELLSQLDGDFSKEIISSKEMEKISGLTNPSEILALAQQPKVKPTNYETSLIVALDGIRDPGNMGTIIRTARWFGVTTILCATDCVDAYNPKVVQGAMGALFHTNLHSCNLVDELKEAQLNGFQLITATLSGSNVYNLPQQKKTVLVIGNESHGVSTALQAMSNIQVKIPNYECEQRVESLNAASATAILLSVITQRNAQ
jgi:TrmH family RNA methyltransferase